jgi:hypothetical protein
MRLFAGLLILVGLGAAAWGFPVSHRNRQLLSIVASFSILIGIAAFILGVLLLIIPDFFE